jgi:hypothetical protein
MSAAGTTWEHEWKKWMAAGVQWQLLVTWPSLINDEGRQASPLPLVELIIVMILGLVTPKFIFNQDSFLGKLHI